MAMRDPGPPGRNPFFDHGPDADLGDAGTFADELRDAGFDPTDWGLPDDGPRDWPGGGGDGRPDPFGTLAALVDALQGAQPEAAEHLVAAAHELVLAVKTVVDATEAVLAAQRAAMPAPATEPPPADPATEPTPEARPDPASGVRRIDLA